MADVVESAVALLRAETEQPEVIETALGQVVLFSARRPGAQRPTEDSSLVLPLDGALLLAVADGAGGHELGGEASEAAIAVITEELYRSPSIDGAKVSQAFAAASAAVLRLGHEAITTLVVALIDHASVRTWHCGDSTALLMGQRGKRKLRTIDHTPPGLRAGEGTISFDDVHRDNQRHLLVTALGIEPLQIEHSGPVPLARRDTLLVASDGLFDNLLDGEIVEHLRKGPLAKGVAAMTERALQRMRRSNGDSTGKPDDLSLLVFRPRG
jgi:PPM family protein phosphatase